MIIIYQAKRNKTCWCNWNYNIHETEIQRANREAKEISTYLRPQIQWATLEEVSWRKTQDQTLHTCRSKWCSASEAQSPHGGSSLIGTRNNGMLCVPLLLLHHIPLALFHTPPQILRACPRLSMTLSYDLSPPMICAPRHAHICRSWKGWISIRI